MRKILLGLALLLPAAVFAGTIEGTYKTEDKGNGQLLVEFHPCKTDAAKSCATIIGAFNAEGMQVEDYKHSGRQIVFGLVDLNDGRYARGKVWTPDTDKTYSLKIKTLSENTLEIKGCVGIFCREQIWVQVN